MPHKNKKVKKVNLHLHIQHDADQMVECVTPENLFLIHKQKNKKIVRMLKKNIHFRGNNII